MTALIEAEGLAKSFGTLKAVDGITLKVARGEVLGFLGPNGAGKSTTMRLITGFLEPDAGRARIAGFDVQDQAREAKKRLGYLPEGAPLYAEMTPKGLLSFVAELRGLTGDAIAKAVGIAAEKTGLGPVLEQTIETLSKGYKRRVGIAQAILHDPEVLIMDEPTDGLDPNQKHQVRELIAEMAKEKAIIVSTHILEEVEAVCTRAVVINKGRIVADGTAEDLMRRLPYHGAVAIRVAPEKADAVKGALNTLTGVAKIETVGTADGQLHLRAIPKNGAGIVTDVASAIRQKSLAVDEIFVERGKLDDVFRQITTSDLDKPHA
jgi:ABC-2 type transport system ATP-binding protein